MIVPISHHTTPNDKNIIKEYLEPTANKTLSSETVILATDTDFNQMSPKLAPSTPSTSQVNISMHNVHTSPVALALIDLDQTEKPSGILKPGETCYRESFERQKWISRDIFSGAVISEFIVPNYSDMWTICKYQYSSTNATSGIEEWQQYLGVSKKVSLSRRSSSIPSIPSIANSQQLGFYPSNEDEPLDHLTMTSSGVDSVLELTIFTLNISNFIDRAVSFVSFSRYGIELSISTIEPSISIDKESFEGQKWLARDLKTNAILSEYLASRNASFWVILEDIEPSQNKIFQQESQKVNIDESKNEVLQLLPGFLSPDVSKSLDSELPHYSSGNFSQAPIEKSSKVKVATNEFQYYRILLQSAILHEVQKVFSQTVNDASTEIIVTKEKISKIIETTINGFLPERGSTLSSRATEDQISNLPKELVKYVVDEALIQSAEITHKMSVVIAETTERVSSQAQQVMKDLASDASFLKFTAQNATSQRVSVARNHICNVKEQLKNVVVELPREFANFGSHFAESFTESVINPIDIFSDLTISTELSKLDVGKSTEIVNYKGQKTSTVLFEAQEDSSSPSVAVEILKPPSNAGSNVSDMLFMIPTDDLESMADSYDFGSAQDSDFGEISDFEEKSKEGLAKNLEFYNSPPPLPPRLYEEEEEFLLGASSVIDEAFTARLPEFEENTWNLL
ncbi:hypothetical protein HK096_007292 [Nowakowskiella sp. JEL0078]|nr:hypothetical protein HK096_007292 [Nowakowskiella sp. JEL0078]